MSGAVALSLRPAEAPPEGVAASRASLAHHSKSFALAGKLLPRACRDDAAVVYAWCRRADDLVDLAPPGGASGAAAQLRRELDGLYAGERQEDPVLAAFQAVVTRRRIPRAYPDALVAGMEMDARPLPLVYEDTAALSLYCYRVAGVVGLMMSHVMGVRDEAALRRAAHLGMAMQLTNIARDVLEDWQRGRLYVPADHLGAAAREAAPGGPLPEKVREALARALPALLARADWLYRSGDRGLSALSFRCAVAIRTARLVYAAIGDELRRRAYDVTAGRAVVPRWRKLLLAARALVGVTAGRAATLLRPLPPPTTPTTVLRYPDDVDRDLD
jgi:phytoene synthase